MYRYETREHTLEVDGVSHKVMLYDTAGQEEYDKLRIEYLKNKQPDVIILCYAVDNMISFKNIQHKWIPELRNRTPIVLVATKIDIRRKTHISYEQGEELKKKIKAKSFVECSSKDFINIDSVFEEAVRVSIGQRNNIEDYFSRIKFQGRYKFINSWNFIFDYFFFLYFSTKAKKYF